MTLRQEATRRLAADSRPLPETEPFTTRLYQPEDGYGVTRLFYAVYGDGYPIDTFYLPERLTEENRAGRIRSAVARTEDGQVVSHIALYRSSAPNPELYEYGLGLTLPAYRASLAFARCNSLLLSLVEDGVVDSFFGEAVCNHIITQKLTRQSGAIETALEPALMPARAYEAEQSADGRVGCIISFKVCRDRIRPLCIPSCYHQELTFAMEGLKLGRELIPDNGQLSDENSQLDTVRFDHAGVARCTITTPGRDLVPRLLSLEAELRQAGYAVLQCFIPLGDSRGAAAATLLQQAGFFLGGFLPAWFGEDGLLMQKLFIDPGFESLKLHSERARTLAALVQNDWQRSLEG